MHSSSNAHGCGFNQGVLQALMVGSGRTMARTGLRMMPTSPSSPLKFRAAGFPRHGFKAGLSGGPACATSTWYAAQLTSTLRAPRLQTAGLRSVPEALRAGAPPCERPLPLYPRGPRSGLGYVVPVHQHLLGPIRPTREHIAISPRSGLCAMPSLCHGLGDPRVVPCFRCAFCVDMPPSTDPGEFAGCIRPAP